ncbi:MAG: hypothetical protein DRG73_03035 [Deltaproteobacteria bacterium]|nr:MAG: hypothetical protein DRG73_03035 [Deltaproteobacteria bacterium]
MKARKKTAIIASYFAGESYGLPGLPLIIHHASGLGNWIREIETREGVQFKRYGSIIGWWHEEKR